MKATYTYTEAVLFIKQVLEDKTGQTGVMVELTPDTDWASQIKAALTKAGCFNDWGSIRADMKIAAIKALRQFTSENAKQPGFYPMGLADSKYSIENIDKFLKFVKANSRLPEEGSCSPEMGMLR